MSGRNCCHYPMRLAFFPHLSHFRYQNKTLFLWVFCTFRGYSITTFTPPQARTHLQCSRRSCPPTPPPMRQSGSLLTFSPYSPNQPNNFPDPIWSSDESSWHPIYLYLPPGTLLNERLQQKFFFASNNISRPAILISIVSIGPRLIGPSNAWLAR